MKADQLSPRLARQPGPELSRPVPVSRLQGRDLTLEIEATPAERAALAARFDLLSLDRLVATVDLQPPDLQGRIAVSGRFVADVVQRCVVTLDPVSARVEDEFAVQFAELSDDEAEEDIEVLVEAEDPPEPIVDGAVEIGEVIAQHVALALDPYPRCPAASIDALEADLPSDAGTPHPFAALAQLRAKMVGDGQN